MKGEILVSLTAGGLVRDLHQNSQEKLIKGLKAGDEDAVIELVFNYSDRLLRAATVILKDQYLAEDVVQDSLLVAVSKIEQLRSNYLFPWLYKILVSNCRKKQRRKYWNMLEFWPHNDLELVPAFAVDVETQIIEETLNQEVFSAISELPLKYREIITLYYLEQFSLEEISSITKEPLGTIKSRLHRARKRLKQVLLERGKLK